ncbi:MAG: hypothetical protein WCX16_06810 [Candidatus Omnitrophota bacterium]
MAKERVTPRQKDISRVLRERKGRWTGKRKDHCSSFLNNFKEGKPRDF